jgi:hypothetical protein
MKKIAVFCGARLGVRTSRKEVAVDLMQAFHKEKWGRIGSFPQLLIAKA